MHWKERVGRLPAVAPAARRRRCRGLFAAVCVQPHSSSSSRRAFWHSFGHSIQQLHDGPPLSIICTAAPGLQVLVNYGSSWCTHCHHMFPHFISLTKKVSVCELSLV